MSGSNLIGPLDLYNNAAIAVGTVTSSILSIQFQDNVGIVFNYTGTPTGTIAVQVSNNYILGNPPTAAVWAPLTLSGSLGPTGGAGTQTLSLNQLGFGYLRLVYTGTLGAGNINAFVNAKQV